MTTKSVAIDLQGAQGPSRNRGIGRYVHMLFKSMLELSQDDLRYSAVISPNAPIPKDLFNTSKLRFATLDLPPKAYLSKHSSYLDDYYNRLNAKYDTVLIGSPFEGYQSLETTSPSGAISWADTSVPIVYDLIPLRFPNLYFQHNQAYEQWYFSKLDTLIKADHLLSISEATKQDLVDLLCVHPDKISVIGAGVPANFRTDFAYSDAVRAKCASFGENYFITVYQEDHRKNPELLLRAFASLPFHLRLYSKIVVVTSHNEHSKTLKDYAYSLGLEDKSVVITGYINDEELACFYSNATAMVFPSIYEGFGLPALEAILAGTLALVSDQSSLPEVVGTSETLFNPYDEEDLRTLLVKASEDKEWSRNLKEVQLEHAQRFRWPEIASRAHESLLHINDSSGLVRDANSTRTPKKIFITSPVPPTKSGIATYLSSWVRALSQYADIVVVPDGSIESITDHYLALNSTDKSHFDTFYVDNAPFVHHLGNQPFYHSYQLEFIERYGGVVVLHDVILDHFSDFIGRSDIPIPNSLKDLIQALPRPRADMDMAYIAELRRLRLRTFLLWIWEQSTFVVFHSEHAKHLFMQLTGVSSEKLKVSPLGQSTKVLTKAPVEHSFAPSAPTTIVIPGFIDLSKSPFTAVHAVGLLERSIRPVIKYLGTGDETLIKSLNSTAKRLAVDIDVTGYLDDSSFVQQLSNADIAIVLRSHDRGESSAVAHLALAFGLPLIVEANGSFDEFPGSVCIKLNKVDTESLASAINLLLNDKDLRQELSANARAYVAHTLSWAQVANSVIHLLGTPRN